jgi:non-ribosomal peptide synthetase component F
MSGSPAPSLSLAPEERHRILHEWNDTTREYPRDLSLHQVFDAQAQRTPEAIAVVRGRERVTYRQLGASADAVSRRLRRRGVRRDTLVAICPDRSIAMVAGLLGILKAGGAYVPLDPTYPRERVEFMLRDAGARVVLTQERFRSVFEGAGRDVIPLEAGSWESDDATEDLGGDGLARG